MILLRIFLVLFIALDLGYLISKAPQLHRDYLRSAVGSSVVEVVKLDEKNEIRGGGTGFSIQAPSGKTYIMTNAHICDMYKGDKNAVIQRPDGSFIKRPILFISGDTDLCLIEGIDGLRGLKIASKVFTGEIIEIIGHPHLMPLNVSYGDILGTDNVDVMIGVIGYDMPESECKQHKNKILDAESFFGPVKVCVEELPAYLTTAVSMPGNSGSPVVDFSGHVVGVLFAGDNSVNWGIVVPLSDVKAFLKDK